MDQKQLKPLSWVGSSYRDYTQFPELIQDEMGFALFRAQEGERHPSAKMMKGFGGGSVVEIVQNNDGNTFRSVYTVRFAEEVYVLHAFQKKSKKGVTTPRSHIDLIKRRPRKAEEDYRRRHDNTTDKKDR
jgi:phage-related protein